MIRGGSNTQGVAKGFVVSTQVDPKVIATQSQVTYLKLANMNLANTIDDIIANLPSGLQTLDLTNTVLTEFPSGVTKLKLLRSLCVCAAVCCCRCHWSRLLTSSD